MARLEPRSILLTSITDHKRRDKGFWCRHRMLLLLSFLFWLVDESMANEHGGIPNQLHHARTKVVDLTSTMMTFCANNSDDGDTSDSYRVVNTLKNIGTTHSEEVLVSDSILVF